MEVVQPAHVVNRLAPFIRGGVVRRSRLERVLGTAKGSVDDLRHQVERLLSESGIAIEEDQSEVELEIVDEPANTSLDDGHVELDGPKDLPLIRDDAAIAAARARLRKDRHIKNHAKVLLRAEEEVGLAMLVRGRHKAPLAKGDFGRLTGESRMAAECLLVHNQGLISSFALRFAPAGMTFDDLFQHGALGLIRAIELFDPSRGYKFSTYAMHWVRQAITRGIGNESRLIRLPVHMVERVQKVWATRARLTVAGEPPAVQHLARECALSVDATAECLRLGPHSILSLDTPVGAEGESTLADFVDLRDPSLSPEHQLELESLRSQVDAVLDTVSEREAGVIRLRFGLVDDKELTLDQIGQVYGVTRERIRQIEGKALTKLRHPSRLEVLAPFMFGGADLPEPEQEPDSEEESEGDTVADERCEG